MKNWREEIMESISFFVGAMLLLAIGVIIGLCIVSAINTLTM